MVASCALPDEAGTWEPLSLEAHVNDIYLESQHALWAATDRGLYVNRDDIWTRESVLPGDHLVITHGYVFALGEDTIFRMASGGIENDRRELELPPVDAAPQQFVMLGSHSHVLRDAIVENGGLQIMQNHKHTVDRQRPEVHRPETIAIL